MGKLGWILAILTLSVLLLAGCIAQQPNPSPSPTPSATPNPTSMPTPTPSASPSPTATPTIPPLEKVWVEIFPVQCLGNPWEQDWLDQGNEYGNYPMQTEDSIIKEYYRKFGIDIYEIRKVKISDVVCAACNCGNGYRYEFLVDAGDANRIDSKGNATEESRQELQLKIDYAKIKGQQMEEAAVRIASKNTFIITATVRHECVNRDAYWTSGEGWIEVNFVDSYAGTTPAEACTKVLAMDSLETTLDTTPVFWVVPPQKIIVKHNGVVIGEKAFQGAFCGGIAAFPCPDRYECMLEGTYPDAGGKCTATFGILQGKVSIGPICPVEREGLDCSTPPEAYAARKILIYEEDGKTLLKEVYISSTGTYMTVLEPGTYVLDIARTGIDYSNDVPTEFTIASGEVREINISIDTGIR